MAMKFLVGIDIQANTTRLLKTLNDTHFLRFLPEGEELWRADRLETRVFS